MKLNVYAIKDIKLGKFAQPIIANNDEIMKRMLTAAVNSEEITALREFPEDFDLYKIGEYSEETGKITSKVEFITNAAMTKKSNKE